MKRCFSNLRTFKNLGHTAIIIFIKHIYGQRSSCLTSLNYFTCVKLYWHWLFQDDFSWNMRVYLHQERTQCWDVGWLFIIDSVRYSNNLVFAIWTLFCNVFAWITELHFIVFRYYCDYNVSVERALLSELKFIFWWSVSTSKYSDLAMT